MGTRGWCASARLATCVLVIASGACGDHILPLADAGPSGVFALPVQGTDVVVYDVTGVRGRSIVAYDAIGDVVHRADGPELRVADVVWVASRDRAMAFHPQLVVRVPRRGRQLAAGVILVSGGSGGRWELLPTIASHDDVFVLLDRPATVGVAVLPIDVADAHRFGIAIGEPPARVASELLGTDEDPSAVITYLPQWIAPHSSGASSGSMRPGHWPSDTWELADPVRAQLVERLEPVTPRGLAEALQQDDDHDRGRCRLAQTCCLRSDPRYLGTCEGGELELVWCPEGCQAGTRDSAHCAGARDDDTEIPEQDYCDRMIEPIGVPGTWVTIRAGTFSMGSPVTERGRFENEPQHQVTLTRDFLMLSTEVTRRDFEAVMRETLPTRESLLCSDCPAGVGWDTAAELCNALSDREWRERCYDCVPGACEATPRHTSPYDCTGYRLPTEAEWEYAARAADPRATYNGEIDVWYCEPSATLDPIAWHCGNEGDGLVHPVGQLRPNAWGLYDMIGNEFEWCHDLFGDPGYDAVTDPVGVVAYRGLSYPPAHVTRSGDGFRSLYESLTCRAAFRTSLSAAGIRPVRTLP